MQTKTETCFVRVGPWVPGQPQQTLNFFVILFTKLGLCLFRLTFQTKIKSSSHSIMNLFHHGAYQQSTRSIFFQSRDDIENFSYSISRIETRQEFLALNLRLRDKTENFFFNPRHRDEIEIHIFLS